MPRTKEEFLKELLKPRNFRNGINNSSIFRLSTGAGNCLLALRRPGNQVVPKKHNIA
jgi:hypothetical protein